MIVAVPLMAFGICAASVIAGVHAALVPRLLPIVPLVPPKENDSLCVNELEARDIVIVTAVPMSTLDAESVGVVARGIVVNVPLPLPVTVPIHEPDHVISIC